MKPNNNAQAIPMVIRQILDDTLDAAIEDIDSLFSICDELFFDLSTRADSDHEETLYFESMREIRSNDEAVTHTYQKGIIASFAAAVKGTDMPFAPSTGREAGEGLELLENKQLEIDIAINNLAANARKMHQDTLSEITLRLNELFPNHEINQENNPLDPVNIGRAFSYACQKHLDINVKCLVIILKQFERHVLNKLGYCFTAANQLLLDEGVLPEITDSMKHQISNQPPHSEASYEDIEPAIDPMVAASSKYSTPQFDMGNLSSLIASAKQTMGTGPVVVGNYTFSNYSVNPGPAMPSSELVQHLTQAQPNIANEHQASGPRNFIKEVISALLSQKQPDLPQALSEAEDNIINLVSMFFDFILDDDHIPMAIKLQISRLQIPVLKSALRDRDFFSSQAHPGRELINTIAAVGIGFDESKPAEKDSTYKAIASITETINSQYTDNDDIFLSSLETLRGSIDKESRKSTIIERRTDQAETGRSKLKQAKITSRTLLIERLDNTKLPEDIKTFLLETWLDVLVMTYLKEGEDSPSWVDASQTISDLIWVCQPHESQKAKTRLNEFKLDLPSRIKNGLQLIKEDIDEQTGILSIVDEFIYQAEANNIDNDSFVQNSQESIADRLPKDEQLSDMRPNAIQKQKEKYLSLVYGFIQKAEQMPIGTWLNYLERGTGKDVRCKLSSKLSNIETYIFVNRFGFKVLEKHRKEFAYDLQRGRAVPLDAGPLFDRVFEKISQNLRSASAS